MSEDKNKDFRTKAAIFLASVGGISTLIGFSSALGYAKRKDPSYFDKGVAGAGQLEETGAALALRALARGTVYAFVGCGLLFYGIWKLSGAENRNQRRPCHVTTSPDHVTWFEAAIIESAARQRGFAFLASKCIHGEGRSLKKLLALCGIIV